MKPLPPPRLSEREERSLALIKSTAEELWDVAGNMESSGYVTADDWEAARSAASHLLAMLEVPCLKR
jgi:hypothetical protein